jgi:hypothetical protein
MSWHSDENQEERQLVDNKSQNNLDICFIVLVHGVSKNVLEMINCVVSIMCSHEDSAENCKNRDIRIFIYYRINAKHFH